MKTYRLALIVAVVLAIAIGVTAQQPPNLERGFAADKIYQLSNIDNVNAFNGNLLAALPIGQRFPLSSSLSYGFSLTYNSKLWDYVRRQHWDYTCSHPPGDPAPGDPPPDCIYQFQYFEYEAVANRRSNAGLGWLFTIGGRFHDADDLIGGTSPSTGGVYESPDGAEHAFYGQLHRGDFGGYFQPAYYTNDNSFLRLRLTPTNSLATHAEIDFPDGSTNEFEPDGTGNWRLTRRRDQYKDASGNYRNWMTVNYAASSPPCSASDAQTHATTTAVWIINDSQQRRHDVCLSSVWYEAHYVDAPNAVVLAGFQGQRSVAQSTTYAFVYTQENIDRGLESFFWPNDPPPSPQVNVPTLTSLILPDNAKFDIAYNRSYSNTGVPMPAGETGAVHSIKLPTGGIYIYDYQEWDASFTNACPTDPNIPGNDYSWSTKTPGIKIRHEFDAGLNEVATWQYLPSASLTPGGYTCTPQDKEHEPQDSFAPNAELAVSVITPAGNKNIHYFSIWPGMDNQRSDWNGFLVSEYALPVTRNPARLSADGLPLSTEAYEKDGSGNYVLKRQTFATYGADPLIQSQPSSITDRNRHITLDRTVYHDDGDKYVQTTYGGEDGFGHQRTITATGTFGSDIARTIYTNYNPGSDANGTTGGSLYFPPTGPWILNTFTDSALTQAAVTAQSTSCFDGTTGFLLGRKTINSFFTPPPVVHRADVVALFQNDGMGNVQREDWFGGDKEDASAMTSLCAPSSGTPAYRIAHTYSNGVLSGTTYQVPASGSTIISTLDQTIDSTGLVWKSRDPAAVETVFNYDPTGRVTSVTSPGTANVSYEYHNPGDPGYAVPTAVASVTSSVAGNNLTHKIEYDAFGRIQKETRSISAGTTSQITVYDAGGRKKSVTEWETTPSSNASTHATQYTYDAFGRPLSITAPDHTAQHPSIRTFSYLGARQITRRELIGSTATPADTTETYDIHGRLMSVLDANNVTTTYTYDVANRLATVLMGSQPRGFSYDTAGFLRSETHPENGTTSYGDYDARGHVGSKTINGANSLFDQTFTYDSAERLFQIKSRDPNAPSTFRISKEFTYSSANPNPFDLAKGKLSAAKRYNYDVPGAGPITVTEEYQYINPAGHLSDKTTTIAGIGSASRKIYQTYKYNDLGLLSEVDYPSPDSYGTPTWSNLLPKYTAGRFVGASTTGYFPGQPNFTNSDIAYWANGMLNAITHNNGVTDTYAIDATNALPRPNQIKFENWTAPITCTPPSIASQSASDTIYYADPKTIAVTATGDSLTYQWYLGQSAIAGATSTSYPVTTNQTGSYWVRVSNTCGHADSPTITVTVRLRPPAALVADRMGSISINVTWQAANGATSYQVFREAGGVWSLIGTPGATSFADNSGPAASTFVYRVAAIGANVLTSGYSNSDMESTLTFTNVAAGVTVTYAQFNELLTGLNALRWAAGDPPWSWSQVNTQGCAPAPIVPQQGGVIYAAHILALRCAMDNALQRVGVATTTYTDQSLVGVPIKAVHVRELQQRTDYLGDNR
jgi:YD repeat-containing protein